MSNLTALQQAMRIVEQYAPQLFDTYNANGRRFVDEMTKLLALEQWQIEQAYDKGNSDAYHGKHKKENYYNETYKGGEQ